MANWEFQCKICLVMVLKTETYKHLLEHPPADYYVPVMGINWEDLLGKAPLPKPKKKVEPEEDELADEVEEE